MVNAVESFKTAIQESASPGESATAELFWNLSHQLDHISGLMNVSSEAVYQLKKRRKQNPQA